MGNGIEYYKSDGFTYFPVAKFGMVCFVSSLKFAALIILFSVSLNLI